MPADWSDVGLVLLGPVMGDLDRGVVEASPRPRRWPPPRVAVLTTPCGDRFPLDF
jgi:hypothetical protein